MNPTYADLNKVVTRMELLEAWHYNTVVGVLVSGVLCGLIFGFIIGKYLVDRPKATPWTTNSRGPR